MISALRFLIAAICFMPKIVEGLKNPELVKCALELGAWLFGRFLLHVDAYAV